MRAWMLMGWCALLTLSFSANAANQLLSQIPSLDGETLRIDYEFAEPVKQSDVQVQFINQTIQLEIANAKVPAGKTKTDIEQESFKSVYSYQKSPEQVWSRIIMEKPLKAKDYKESVRLQATDNFLTLMVKPPSQGWKSELAPRVEALKVPRVLPEKEIVKAAAELNKKRKAKASKNDNVNTGDKKVTDAQSNEVVEADVTQDREAIEEAVAAALSDEQIAKLPENKIPVLTETKSESVKEAKSPYWRMVISLGIIAFLGLGLILFSKWWSKNYKKDIGSNNIRVMNQHYLGPKKSLAIVRVAGEHILLGVTDHNINMIKTLALMDDDLPEDTPENFSGAMAKADIDQEHDGEDEFSFGDVKSTVQRKLREMRSI